MTESPPIKEFEYGDLYAILPKESYDILFQVLDGWNSFLTAWVDILDPAPEKKGNPLTAPLAYPEKAFEEVFAAFLKPWTGKNGSST